MPTLIHEEPFKDFPKISDWLAKVTAEENYKKVDAPFQEIRKTIKDSAKKQ